MYCRKCGAEIKETSKFCDSCGCEVVKVKQVSYAEKYNENKKKNKKCTIKIYKDIVKREKSNVLCTNNDSYFM